MHLSVDWDNNNGHMLTLNQTKLCKSHYTCLCFGVGPAASCCRFMQRNHDVSGRLAVRWHDVSSMFLAGRTVENTIVFPALSDRLLALETHCTERKILIDRNNPANWTVTSLGMYYEGRWSVPGPTRRVRRSVPHSLQMVVEKDSENSSKSHGE